MLLNWISNYCYLLWISIEVQTFHTITKTSSNFTSFSHPDLNQKIPKISYQTKDGNKGVVHKFKEKYNRKPNDGDKKQILENSRAQLIAPVNRIRHDHRKNGGLLLNFLLLCLLIQSTGFSIYLYNIYYCYIILLL